MSPARRDAIQRRATIRGRWTRGPVPVVVVGIVVYAVLMYLGSLDMMLAWRFPEHEGQVFPGVASLSTAVTVANALWVVLLVVEGVACLTNRARPGRLRIAALLAALGLVAMLQWWAVLVRDAASW